MKKIIILIICLFLCSCGVKELSHEDKKVVHEDKEGINLNQIIKNVEVYSDVFVNDIIEPEDSNIKFVGENYQIDTTKLGKQTLDYIYEYNNKKYVYKYNIDVVDTIPPLVFSGTNKTVNVNYKGEACNLISYGDNYTGDVKCEISGTYDFTKVGTYKLVYKLSDSSNNTKEVNVTLNVVKPSTGGGGNTSATHVTTDFKDILEKHKRDNTEIGIDVSKWQGNIDFEKVKNAGATFVIMRIGVEGSSTNKISIDEYYKSNIRKAKAAGLKVGVYLYSIATSVEEATQHADWVINTLDGEELDLPIVFDWENWSSWNTYKMSFYDINNVANTFMKRVEEKGYKGMLYSSKFYLETIWTNKENYPVWLAHYTKQTNYEGDYMIWQLCNNGKIDGVSGDVDIDVLYKK